MRLLRRDFEVPLPPAEAWRFLARVEDWPTWAGHIRRVATRPPGEIGPDTIGRIHLRNGIRTAFRMVTFDPFESWCWVGRFLWLTVRYDHRFEDLGGDRTRLVWVVDAEGAGARNLGAALAIPYRKNLDKAIPRLVAAMAAAASGASRTDSPPREEP